MKRARERKREGKRVVGINQLHARNEINFFTAEAARLSFTLRRAYISMLHTHTHIYTLAYTHSSIYIYTCGRSFARASLENALAPQRAACTFYRVQVAWAPPPAEAGAGTPCIFPRTCNSPSYPPLPHLSLESFLRH